MDTSQVALFGRSGISTPALETKMKRNGSQPSDAFWLYNPNV
jgi:hypothetical protein